NACLDSDPLKRPTTRELVNVFDFYERAFKKDNCVISEKVNLSLNIKNHLKMQIRFHLNQLQHIRMLLFW
ncbi:27666_t:CDS:1, partial [Racocetra persica]